MNYILELVRKEDKNVLYQLLQFSLFEESNWDMNDINEKAEFEYKWFDNYFTDQDRQSYLVKDNDTNKILGFVMINQYMQKFSEGHSIAEFMIMPKYRKQNLGKRVAFEIFNKYRGNWEIQPSYGSKDAYAFWVKVIDEYTNNNNEYKDGIFCFSN